MTTTSSSDVYYDTYDVAINADPYPVYRRLREEAPVYYNDARLLRGESLRRRGEGTPRRPDLHLRQGRDHRADQGDIEMPPASSSSRILRRTPSTDACSRAPSRRAVAELEPKIPEFCATSLDPLRERTTSTSSPNWRPDADAGDQHAPRHSRDDQEAVRDHVDANLRTQRGADAGLGELRDRCHVRRLRRLAGRSIPPTTS